MKKELGWNAKNAIVESWNWKWSLYEQDESKQYLIKSNVVYWNAYKLFELLCRLLKDHSLIDGNKRAAIKLLYQESVKYNFTFSLNKDQNIEEYAKKFGDFLIKITHNLQGIINLEEFLNEKNLNEFLQYFKIKKPSQTDHKILNVITEYLKLN